MRREECVCVILVPTLLKKVFPYKQLWLGLVAKVNRHPSSLSASLSSSSFFVIQTSSSRHTAYYMDSRRYCCCFCCVKRKSTATCTKVHQKEYVQLLL
jgi:hypothetical protein